MKFVFVFISILLLSACHRENRPKYVIGVSQCSDDLWRKTMNEEMQREIAFYPEAQIVIKSVKDNTQEQLRDIEYFIEQKVNLLIIAPNESQAFTSVVQKAYNSGIPVILIDRKTTTEHYTAYLGANNYQIGKEAALYAASVLGGKGNIVELRGYKGSTSDTERHRGFTDGLKGLPDIRVIAQPHANFLKEEAQKQMIAVFEKHNNIDLIFAQNDPMAAGAHEASLLFSGQKPFIIGVDALQKEGIENILQGKQNASFLYPTGGDRAIELAMKILRNEPFEKENTLHTSVVDKSNVRILQLQTEQIIQKQLKIDHINQSLNESLAQHTTQKTLLYISAIATALVVLLLIIAIVAYRTEHKARAMLTLKNKKIQNQADVLLQQKQQLETISQQLEEATQAKLLFFTNISHEFKTPLTLILSPLETLLQQAGLLTSQRELLLIIQKNAHRLLHLISEIIEFRSYENGKMKMHFTRKNLKTLLEEINPLFTNWIKQKQVQFDFLAQEASFDIIIDKDKVEKIYFNLLSNALKFVDTKGQVQIRLSHENNGVCLTIFNSGSFIAHDKLDDVFEQFYKINPSSEGTGIGLALTKALVEAHNGKITVQSQAQWGTSFKVWLPYEQELSPVVNLPSQALKANLTTEPSTENSEFIINSSTDNTKPLILVVEDNSDMRKFICQLLQDQYAVIQAKQGQDGIVKAQKYLPDLIISDVMMPQKNGFELCQELKESILTSHIPIVLLTAYSLDEQKQMGFESGADAYIPKPFNAQLLLIRIRKLIENRQRMQQLFSDKLFNASQHDTLGKSQDKFLSQFKNYVEANINNTELNIDTLAEQMGLSRSQLYRKIKQITNYSPNELIRIVRVQKGKQLLMQNTKSVSEVAYEVGFSSPSYFAKCFKNQYGQSPTAFIENI